MSYYREFSELFSQTLVSISGLDVGSDSVTFECASGKRFCLYHSQNCCESVSIEDVAGEASDLLNSPILLAEEEVSGEHPEGFQPEYNPESFTWTFYKLATVNGYVTIRWYGKSNGYYSESVHFIRTDEVAA